MQVLHIIFTVAAIAANGAMTFLAYSAWLKLRRMEHDAAVTKRLMIALHIKEIFDEVNRMKKVLHELVENEQFEEANNLKVRLSNIEARAVKLLNQFNELYGEDVAEISVLPVNAKDTPED